MFSPIRRGEETERIHVVNCFKRQFSNDGLQASQQNKSMAAPYGTEPAQETQLLIDSFFFISILVTMFPARFRGTIP